MNYDRITQLRIAGLRCIESLTLDVKGLAVLIGDNGSGKSTVLEALELLHQAAMPVSFVQDILYRRHGGLQSLLRRGSKEIALGVTVQGSDLVLRYDFSIAEIGTSVAIVNERLEVFPDGESNSGQVVIERDGAKARYLLGRGSGLVDKQIGPATLAVAMQGLDVHPAVERLGKALEEIEFHVSFETRPTWQQQDLEIRVGPRKPTYVDASQSLARYALNLASCFQQLRNHSDETWSRVRERLRLGLGEDFRDLRLYPPTPGNIALGAIFGAKPDKPIPIDSLSEGQIAYLAFVALVELHPNRSILAFDEPELHLHPALLARVVGMLEEVGESCPVILATHSDRLLDALANPSRSVVLCDLDEARRSRLVRPNAERLAEWLETYRGLGSIRAEGYEEHIFDDGPVINGALEKGR